jgi:hypothetical protein
MLLLLLLLLLLVQQLLPMPLLLKLAVKGK